MILNITTAQFPDVTLSDIEYSRNIYRSIDFNSCTARAIMKILLERGYIDQSDYTSSKELEIYREIWLEPGKVASPEKIVSYFHKHQLNVVGIEIKELSKSALHKYSRDPVITSLYSLFKKDVPTRKN